MANVTRFMRGGKIADNAQAVRVISNVVDFSLLAVTAADVVRALKIDAGTIVFSAGLKCITAEGGTATVTIGDETAVDTYIGATDINSTATDVGDALAAPLYYKADDYINLVAGHNLDAAKVYVWAVVANVIGNT